MGKLNDITALESAVRAAVAQTTISDIHTHLFPPSHGRLLLWGADELLTYHYLVAELFTVAPRDLTLQEFWKLEKSRQAELVWEHVFLRHGALSEGARGVITALSALGLDAAGRDLAGIRRWFAAQNIEGYLKKVFELARLDYAVMTNNPFIAEEAGYWKRDLPRPYYMKAALRIDTLILDWPTAAKAMKSAGYRTAGATPGSFIQARKFLTDWAKILQPVYMAASLPPEFAYPWRSRSGLVMDKVVLPVARELGLPIAMMIGVRKKVNPALGDGGDGVGLADPTAVQHLCQRHPDVKFIVTMLSRVNQHELCVLARKFANLHVEGCWWFCNNPSIVEEITRMRLEMLGVAFTAQHSDARVLDQLIYKWAHMRTVLANVLTEKYRDQFLAGWRASEEEIRRDVRSLLGGSFEEFCRK
jgi:hypothetical protein